ncbi:hypothetical protein [Arthrobacter sp. SX1312]|uniref:hypothetical protein n=1 Tax=Arthrobacter sp. SX1312 TaxID=2058896 RepID=UPI0015E201E2|nr:hypothetical protein [Arthrobacter sp. SX1312]
MIDEPTGWQEVPSPQWLILVNLTEPIAVIRRSGEFDRTITWPDLPVGLLGLHVRIVPAPDGAWVLYMPVEKAGYETSHNGATALHISPDGILTPFSDLGHVHCLGTTRHGLWLSIGHWDADVDSEADWLTDRDLLVLDANGGTHRLTADRMPAAAFEDDQSAHLVVYTSAPDASHDGHGGASYTYRFSQIDLPAGALPSTLHITENQAVPVEDDDMPGRSRDEGPGTHPITMDDPRASWTLVELPSEQKKAAIEAVCTEFAHLDSYWTAPSGARTPLSDGLSGTRVDVVGEWPATRVEVSFIHPHYPEGRLRRAYRVFDDAGRIKPTEFAAIHLMEDLDTRDLPPVTNAHNTILDI